MRTQIKRRMLALWLSVCMILTMMPSMAVPTFAQTVESLTITVDKSGKVTLDRYAQDSNTNQYALVDSSNEELQNVASWEDTVKPEAKLEALGISEWKTFSKEGETFTYDDHEKTIVVIEVKSDGGTISKAAAEPLSNIGSADTTPGTVTIKGVDITGDLGSPISAEEAETGVSLSSESVYVGEVTIPYVDANNEKDQFAFESEAGATADANLMDSALPEQGKTVVSAEFSNGTKLENTTALYPDEVGVKDAWVIIEVTAENTVTKTYYVVKLHVEAADTGAELESATIKGVAVDPLVKLSSEEAKSVDLSDDAAEKKYTEIEVPYEQASDSENIAVFEAVVKDDAAAEVKACTIEPLEAAGQKIDDLYTNAIGSSELTGKAQLFNDPKGTTDPIWIAIQVKSQDGKTTNYYLVKVKVNPAVGAAELTSATVKGVAVNLGAPITKADDNKYPTDLGVGASARGWVTVPYAKAAENEDVEKFVGKGSGIVSAVKVEETDLGTLKSIEDIAAVFSQKESSNKIDDADKTKLTTKTTGEEENFWLLVRVVAPNTVDVNYYAINVIIEAASTEAKLLSAAIKTETVENAKLPAGIAASTAASVDLSEAGAENYTEVPLTYEQATSKTLETFVGEVSPLAEKTVTKFAQSDLEADAGKNITSGGTEIKKESKNETSAFEGITGTGDEYAWIVVKVTPESDIYNEITTNTKYYVFKVTVSKKYIIPDVIELGEDQPTYAESVEESDFTAIAVEDNLKIKDEDLADVKADLAYELSEKPEYQAKTLGDAYESWDEVYLHIEPYLDVEVEQYDKESEDNKTVTYDVTPKYNLVVSDSEDGRGSHFDILEEDQVLEVPDGTEVEVTLPLPDAMKSTGKYITHKDKYVYEGTPDDSAHVVFTNPHGFSKFVIAEADSRVAKIGKVGYLTLTDAVEAAENNETIDLLKKPNGNDETLPVVVNKEITINLKADGDYASTATEEEVTGLLAAGDSVEVTTTATNFGSDQTVTFEFTEKPASGPTIDPDDPLNPDEPADPTIGSLTVSKTVVSDDAADKEKEFTFTVTLSDTTVSGVKGGMTFADGVATFTLKDGQSVSASDLPATATYTVAEAAAEGFTASATNATGTIGSGVTVAFTNTKNGSVEPSGNGSLEFTDERQPKALLDRSTTDKDCALKLAADDGDEIVDMKVESSDPSVVKVLKDGKLRYMDLGTAEITVTATGKSGKTYTTTFTVKVTKLGRPTLTVSHVSSKASKTFTVTTSTVRGADGFIVKYSLKKNMSNSGKKKFACGKKLKRQTITVKKAKTTYYVKVRAFKEVDGKIVKYAWSKETEKIKSK